MMQLFPRFNRGIVLLVLMFGSFLGYCQSDTVFFNVVSNFSPKREYGKIFEVDGLGSFEFGEYQIDLELMEGGDFAKAIISLENEVLTQVDSILSISKFYYSTIEDCKVLTFVVYTEILDQRSKGILYSVVSDKGDIDVYTVKVDNAVSPIIIDDKILIIESLKLVVFSLDLAKVENESLIVYSGLLNRDYSYLDTYSISDFFVDSGSVFIEFSRDAFKESYNWYKGTLDNLLERKKVMVLE